MSGIDAALRAGIAVFDAGHYHAAHDAWEDEWLDRPEGSDDERLLHGLIQFSAAVHHVQTKNLTGAVGLSESALGYFDTLPDSYRGVNIGAVREYLGMLERTPEEVMGENPPALTYEGEMLSLENLDPAAGIEAGLAIAENDGYEADILERGAAYAREGLRAGELNKFGVLLNDFAADPDHRPVIATRLEQHVQRRRQREEDVAGLFD